MHSVQQIQLIADSLLPTFIPKDQNQTSLSFHFTVAPGKTYKVNYEKTVMKGKSEWTFINHSEIKKI
jgi:hypothetical protein